MDKFRNLEVILILDLLQYFGMAWLFYPSKSPLVRESHRRTECRLKESERERCWWTCGKQGLNGAAHLDQMWCVLSVQLVLRQLVPVDYPRVSEHEGSSQSLMRVHVTHL